MLRRGRGGKCRLQFSLPRRYERVNCRIPLLGLRFAATSCRASHAYPCLFLLDTDTGNCTKTCPTIMHPPPLLHLPSTGGEEGRHAWGRYKLQKQQVPANRSRKGEYGTRGFTTGDPSTPNLDQTMSMAFTTFPSFPSVETPVHRQCCFFPGTLLAQTALASRSLIPSHASRLEGPSMACACRHQRGRTVADMSKRSSGLGFRLTRGRS